MCRTRSCVLVDPTPPDAVARPFAPLTKIVRRTLETLQAGVASGKLSYPSSVRRLSEFLTGFVPPPGSVFVEREIQSELDNFVSTIVRIEMEEVDRYRRHVALSGPEKDGRTLGSFLISFERRSAN